MNILDLDIAKATLQGKSGTYRVVLEDGVWQFVPVTFEDGYQVSVADFYTIPLVSDGEPWENIEEILRDAFMNIASEVWYGLNPGFVGVWIDDKGTAYIDKSVWISDRLVANTVGAVLAQQTIYDWANDETPKVAPIGNVQVERG